MTMFYPQEDGKLVEIPEEHAAVLALYRERMPVVFEVQEYGQPMLYPLIDVDAEPPCSPLPSDLEYAAVTVARDLRRRRIGLDAQMPNFERLAYAALRAYVKDIAEFAAVMSDDETSASSRRAIATDTARVGRNLTKAIERAVRDAVAGTLKGATTR